MSEWNKLLPTVSGETKPFWEACTRGVYLLQQCKVCEKYQTYYRGFCAHCWSYDVADVESQGVGTVWSYTVTYLNRTPGYKEDLPYVVALVVLEGDVKVFTNIVNCDPEQVHIGMTVKVTFAEGPDELRIPLFEPA